MVVPRETLVLRLRTRAGVVAAVALDARRVTHAAGALVDRPVDEALRLVPLLFALCSRAQAEAASAALDAVCGRTPAEAERAARALLVAVEAVDQHLRALLVDGPEAAGLEPDRRGYASLRRVHAELPKTLHPAGYRLLAGPRPLAPDLGGLEAALAELRGEVERLVPPRVEADPLGVIDTDEGPVGQALRQLRALGLEGVGPAALDPLPGAETVERGLAGDDGFAARPTLDGAPREVGPLAGRREHPAVAAVVDEFGPGILARMVARLVDVRARLAEAEAALSRLEPLAAAADGLAAATGVATGAALTARGPLFHRVALDRGRVRSWTSVAPTEWNLHPGGALRSLEGQPAARAEAAGRWLLAALDPCVPAEVRVEPA